MKSYNLSKDIKIIQDLYDLTNVQFANEINISRMNLSRYGKNLIEPSLTSLEKIYSYPYLKGFHFNEAKVQIMNDNASLNKLLFHGAKYPLKDIDENHLIGRKDFGSGFYLAETYEAASSWVCEFNESSVYAFYLNNLENLKIKRFFVDEEWLYAILYFRGALDKYVLSPKLTKLIDEVNHSDVVIAPIADNQMYDIINQYADGLLTNEQCVHALSATNLGFQYVLKSKKAIQQLEHLERLYLCEEEKKDILSMKRNLSYKGKDKATLAMKQFAHQGKFIYEFFEEK